MNSKQIGIVPQGVLDCGTFQNDKEQGMSS